MSNYDPTKHHRHTTRLPGYDYATPGAYYVTICTRARVPYFNDPICRNMVEEAWKYLPQHFPTVHLGAFTILSDHVHALLWLNPTKNEKPTLSTIVRIFKGDVSRNWSHYMQAEKGGKAASLWQSRFHDHIIRNEHDLQEKRLYILNNPIKHTMKQQGHE